MKYKERETPIIIVITNFHIFIDQLQLHTMLHSLHNKATKKN